MTKKKYNNPIVNLNNIEMDDIICVSGSTDEEFGAGWTTDDETTWIF